MALSEEEQRLLDQLEASLIQDDPRLAKSMASAPTYQVERRKASIAGAFFLLGLILLAMGISWHPIVSIIGFVVMFGSTVLALTSWRKVDASSRPSRPKPAPQTTPLGERMEDRWRRRTEGDL